MIPLRSIDKIFPTTINPQEKPEEDSNVISPKISETLDELLMKAREILLDLNHSEEEILLEQLEKSEVISELFNLLLWKNSPFLVTIYNKDWQIIFANNKFTEETQYTKDEIEKYKLEWQNISSLFYNFSPEQLQKVNTLLNTLEKEKIWYKNMALTLLNKDKEKKYILWNSIPYKGGSIRLWFSLDQYIKLFKHNPQKLEEFKKLISLDSFELKNEDKIYVNPQNTTVPWKLDISTETSLIIKEIQSNIKKHVKWQNKKTIDRLFGLPESNTLWLVWDMANILDTMMTNTALPIIIYTQAWKVAYCNESFEKITWYSFLELKNYNQEQIMNLLYKWKELENVKKSLNWLGLNEQEYKKIFELTNKSWEEKKIIWNTTSLLWWRFSIWVESTEIFNKMQEIIRK